MIIYVKTRSISVVLRPDRRELLSYLDGEVDTNPSIDKYAPIEIAMQRPQPYTKGSSATTTGSSLQKRSAVHEDHDELMDTSTKMSKMGDTKMDLGSSGDQMGDVASQKAALHERLTKKFDEASRPITLPSMPLSDQLTIEKIAYIKAKKKVLQRARVGLDMDDDLPTAGSSSSGPSSQTKKSDSRGSKLMDNLSSSGFISGIGTSGADDSDTIMREIVQRERFCRNRFTVLQSAGKQFDKDISAFLQAIKVKEEGGDPNPIATQTTLGPSNPMNGASQPIQPNTQKSQKLGYNRFDQERYAAKDETGGFVIDTKLTYQPNGGTISLTPNPNATPSQDTTASQLNKSGSYLQSSQLSQQKPNVLATGSSVSSLNKSRPNSVSSSQPQKRTHSNPIIIIPAARTSLIQMINASDILQDLK